MDGTDKVIKQMRTKSQHAIWKPHSRRVDYGTNEANASLTDETRENEGQRVIVHNETLPEHCCWPLNVPLIITSQGNSRLVYT